MQGEARMCKELEDFLGNVQPNEKGIRIAGLYGIPGQGKTTLAKAFCNFNMKNPDRGVCYLEFCGENKLGEQKPSADDFDFSCFVDDSEFESPSEDEAQVELYKRLKGEMVLLVLDNIETNESINDVRDYLGAELGKGSCILLIARSVDVLLNNLNINSESCMEVPSLTEEEATYILLERASLEKPGLSLSCKYAFGIPAIPSDPHVDKELVQAECRGFPLAVQEIVTSNNHKDGLFNRLKKSIDALHDDEKECFSDLAAFPQRKSIRASALLDIWVYVRRMNRDKAVVLLLKLAARHLLHLRGDTRLPSIRDDCLNSYILFQDDVQRNLALFLAGPYNRIHFRRMDMSQEQSDIYPERQIDEYQSSEARIISFHMGAMTDTQWPQIDFPEAEALVLYFKALDYCIPRFLFEIEKLKVLIIHNGDSAVRARLTGLDNFQLPSQLRSLHLEMLRFPSLLQHCKGLESLEKIRLSHCTDLDRDTMFDFPGLLECYVESCSDLDELPARIRSSKSLKVLSITSCSGLRKLPDELGMLGSLKEIRLCDCPISKHSLPPSICNLTNLEILDISSSYVVREEGMSVLMETLQKLAKIPSFRCVICGPDIKQLFECSVRPGLLKFVACNYV